MAAALVAGLGLVTWWAVLAADGRSPASAFAFGVLLAMPFLLLAATIESAGRLDRRGTRALGVAAVGTAIEVGIVLQGFAPLRPGARRRDAGAAARGRARRALAR